MFDLLSLRMAIVVIASGIAAFTDLKTGYVFDKMTYPLIAIGVILNLVEFTPMAFALAAAVFALGFLLYYTGKIGGGDVKLFTGIALVLPFFGKGIFLLNALFIGAVLAVVCFTTHYAFGYAKKNGLNLKENKKGIIQALLIGIFFFLYLLLIAQLNVLSFSAVLLLAIPMTFGLLFLALEKGIRKEFFLKKVKLKELEEDELFAAEFADKKILELLDLKAKGVIGEKEKKKLEKAGIKEVLVYRNAPRFAPFFFLGVVFALAFPDLVNIFFLKI